MENTRVPYVRLEKLLEHNIQCIGIIIMYTAV